MQLFPLAIGTLHTASSALPVLCQIYLAIIKKIILNQNLKVSIQPGLSLINIFR